MRVAQGMARVTATAAILSLTFLFVLTVLIVTLGLAQAAPQNQSSAEGQAIFKQYCVACHTIGGGKLVGPDLQGVTQRRTPQWLTQWIKAPDQMLAQKDPTATQLLQQNNNVPMPNLGLSDAQVASLIAYLGQATAGTAATTGTITTTASTATLPAGDPAQGRLLFTGVTRFQNGGPPCMGCHSIAGLGALGGGALGPDLTPAFNKYGAQGMASFLATVPLPTMNAVWTTHPLTPIEQANLSAFLQQAPQQAPQQGVSVQTLGELAALCVVGAALLIALAQFIWRDRLTGVRQPLIDRARLAQRTRRASSR